MTLTASGRRPGEDDTGRRYSLKASLTQRLNPLLQRKAGLDHRQRAHQALFQQSQGGEKGAAARAHKTDLVLRTFTENCSALQFPSQCFQSELP
jgi:hypothetical protein